MFHVILQSDLGVKLFKCLLNTLLVYFFILLSVAQNRASKRKKKGRGVAGGKYGHSSLFSWAFLKPR